MRGWSTDHAEIRAAVRDVCSRFADDYWDRCDREHEFPEAFFEAFVAGDWLSATVPVEHGGSGLGVGAAAAILEEVAASGGALNACSAVHIPQVAISAILRHGSEELKRRYLPSVADGSLYVAFGVTEPDAGTDTTRVRTTALRDGDRYVVNGKKVWISGLSRASKVLLLTRTTPLEECPRKSDGMTLLLADVRAPSVTIHPIDKIGRNAVDSNEVFFEDHPVDVVDLVGEEGRGFHHLLTGLNSERILLAAEAVGIGRAALTRSIRYANERQVFGRAIGSNQAVQHPLARGYMELAAASLMVREAAEAYDAGRPQSECGILAGAAKYLATEASFRTTDHAMQLHGGYSYARDYHIGRLWVESRLQRIAPVNNEMVLNYVAEHTLGLPRSY